MRANLILVHCFSLDSLFLLQSHRSATTLQISEHEHLRIHSYLNLFTDSPENRNDFKSHCHDEILVVDLIPTTNTRHMLGDKHKYINIFSKKIVTR